MFVEPSERHGAEGWGFTCGISGRGGGQCRRGEGCAAGPGVVAGKGLRAELAQGAGVGMGRKVTCKHAESRGKHFSSALVARLKQSAVLGPRDASAGRALVQATASHNVVSPFRTSFVETWPS